ncbi:DNA-binding NarL/FixJ family response regulator [Salana multivorans]|uniref:DNA-binding NarL/FixJ family response regulator n=1 Tax=Salana multivorans TaxID=120377 RepID=A0A3N2D111_9MICO|nr:helix-turn-helix transcriptional regulator [Salana multivorans]ROR93174.1 DNA-binding NarL/FixJ family response regulator [Salana multivorans]
MSLEPVLAECLGLAVRGRVRAALRLAEQAAPTADRAPSTAPVDGAVSGPDDAGSTRLMARLAAVRASAHFVAADYDAAAEQGERALQLSRLPGADDPLTRTVAVSARLLASAGTLWAGADPDADDRLAAELLELAPWVAARPLDTRRYAGLMLIEALFQNGRVPEAERCLRQVLPEDAALDGASRPAGAPTDDAGPRIPSIPLLPVRVLFYAGRTGEAEEAVTLALTRPELREDPLWSRVGIALLALCAAARGERARARALAHRVSAAFPRPRGYLDSAARSFAGHALAIVGDLAGAAHELRAGGGARLQRFIIVDRALAIEVLVREALGRDDRRAAAGWARLLLDLEGHPVVTEVALRVYAHLDLADGEPESALRRSEAAAARARVTGILRHAAEADLLRSRTLVALGRRAEATRGLQEAVASAGSRGDESGRRDAARQLRALGRRSVPPRGSGWDGLTPREREVAVLVAQGLDNRTIGDAVFLSPRSVGAMVPRILTAFDAPRRAALAPALASVVGDAGLPGPVPALTPRQREVVDLVARGRTNVEIGAALGISPRTVERHVSAAMAASGARSRTALARLAASGVTDADVVSRPA